MTMHDLKCWPDFFSATITGEKVAELRKDDRAFEPHDILCLKEWIGAGVGYTGREALARVTHVLRNAPGIVPKDYALLSIRLVSSTEATR